MSVRRDRHSHQWSNPPRLDNISSRRHLEQISEESIRELVRESIAEEMARGIDAKIMEGIGTKVRLPYGNLNRRKLRIRK